MEKKYLIPLSEYVKSNKADMSPNNDVFSVLNRLNSYTNLITQLINLGQFIACDLDGNVLEEPLMEKYGYLNSTSFEEQGGWVIEGGEDAYYEAKKEYQEAQERVLFKRFSSSQHKGLVKFKQNGSYTFLDIKKFDTLEDLTHLKLELK